MGKADAVTKAYMQDAEVFADAFNCLIYGGEQVIRPEQLHALDTAELASFFGEHVENAHVQVYRDVLKYVTAMEDGEAAYLILGVENQTEVHYAMPVRNMLYDALQYYSQVRASAGKKQGEKLSKAEFLSGFRKSEKLLPVITLVVYFGAEHWDGPRSLHEMLTVRDPRILAYAADYRLNLLEPAAMTDEEIAALKSDLRAVLYFFKYSRDQKKLRELVEREEDFHSMRRSTAEMINTVANTRLPLSEGKERVDMCLAIQQMMEESKAIGIAEGQEIGLARGQEIGLARGQMQGGLKMLFELVRDGLLTVAQASGKAKLSEAEFLARMKETAE